MADIFGFNHHIQCTTYFSLLPEVDSYIALRANGSFVMNIRLMQLLLQNIGYSKMVSLLDTGLVHTEKGSHMSVLLSTNIVFVC